MTVMNAPVLDLLRQRRESLGVDSLAEALADRPSLLRRGALIAAGLVGTVLAALALVFVSHQVVKARMGELVQYEGQANALRTELQARRTRVEALLATNRRLAVALTGVRTSSALLSELQLRTPEGVQLLSAAAGETDLVIRGRADDPLAFARINAMQLDLKRSPFLVGEQVALQRLERQNEASGPEDPRRRLGLPQPVVFQITAPFATLEPQQQLDLMRRLGADGMVRRLQLVQAEGLMP
ncbi:PilN domain-containing protein [Cyanobium sp. FGCU-6]|jgi:type IV pilus assembly protein PilN|nr:PilN domain-containing protein [Cyanobium sp. FGCU6]